MHSRIKHAKNTEDNLMTPNSEGVKQTRNVKWSPRVIPTKTYGIKWQNLKTTSNVSFVILKVNREKL